MTAQAMPHEPSLKMAEMSDEKLADFFFAKAFTDDEPAGEPPTIPKERWQLTPTELEFIRAAASPAQRQRKGGRTYGRPVDRDLRHRPHGRIGAAGTCLAAIGGTATHPRHGFHARVRAVNQVPAGPRRSLDRLRDGLQLLT